MSENLKENKIKNWPGALDYLAIRLVDNRYTKPNSWVKGVWLVTNGYTLTTSQCGKNDLVLCTASNLRVANVAEQREPLVKHIAHRKLFEKLYNIYF